MTRPAHSDFILSDARDSWWNDDFIELMATRLNLGAVRHVLDVGCGHGHWGHMWLRHLGDDVQLIGVDKEQDWLAKATERSEALGWAQRASYRLGTTDQLPVDDDAFDLVTCQTVLMHVADPARAIAEMKRAVAPGALVLLAEPNNLASLLGFTSTEQHQSVQEILQLARFHLHCHRGRIAVGEGDYAIGPQLPAMLAAAGLIDIEVHINDRSGAVFSTGLDAQYAEQWLHEKVRNIQNRVWLWDPTEARRLYLAGDGQEADFSRDYDVFIAGAEAFVEAVGDGSFRSGGGCQNYLISGRVPL